MGPPPPAGIANRSPPPARLNTVTCSLPVDAPATMGRARWNARGANQQRSAQANPFGIGRTSWASRSRIARARRVARSRRGDGAGPGTTKWTRDSLAVLIASGEVDDAARLQQIVVGASLDRV